MKPLLTLILALILALPVTASQMRELNWDDLQPKFEFDDPFAELTQEQLVDLGFVARIRARLATKDEISPATRAEAAQLEAELLKAGVDIDGLLAQREEIRTLREKRAVSVVEELDGQQIKMPGYVLPIEFDGRKVSEFLLVPWVGACIHTPPPPPNQIVHVVLGPERAIEDKGRFAPIWVAGEMHTEATSKNLYLIDGSDDIQIAYRLQAEQVESYQR